MSEHRFAFMPWYPADFTESLRVKAMRGVDRGCYISLLSEAWTKGDDCRLPNDDLILAAACNVTARQWREFRQRWVDGPRPVFEVSEDLLYLSNPRQVSDWNKAVRQAAINRKNGKQGGRPKKNPSEPTRNPTGTQPEPSRNPHKTLSHIPDPISHIPDPNGVGVGVKGRLTTAEVISEVESILRRPLDDEEREEANRAAEFYQLLPWMEKALPEFRDHVERGKRTGRPVGLLTRMAKTQQGGGTTHGRRPEPEPDPRDELIIT